MTSIPATRSIEHGLSYNAASTRSSCTMVTTFTTLTILGKSNWNEMEIYPMLWMWWRMQQTYATTMTQAMTVTMTTLMMKTPLLKTKRIPILPTHKWEDGGYCQRLSHRCRSVVVVVACMHEISPNLGEYVCGFGLWCAFSGIFLIIGVCVEQAFLFLCITST